MSPSTWNTVALEVESWYPSHMLPQLAAAVPVSFGGSWSTLAQHCVVVDPSPDVDPGVPSVGPTSIDPVTGAIARLEKSKGRFGHQLADESLRLGDLLVPVTSRTPALVATTEVAGLAFSTRFIALRVVDDTNPRLIWAILSSTSGQVARANVSGMAAVPALSPEQLLTIGIPEPAHSPDGLSTDLGALTPNPLVRLEQGSAARSNWRTVRLGGTDWAQLIARADELEPEHGMAFSQIGEVLTSRGVPSAQHLQGPIEGSLPLWRAQDVTQGARPQVWVIHDPERKRVDNGDVLITQFGPKHRVAIAEATGVLGSHILAVRLFDSKLSNAIAFYLASPAGQERLHRLESGTTMRRITPTALRGFRVPWPLPHQDQPFAPEDRRTLAEKLEEALWRR